MLWENIIDNEKEYSFEAEQTVSTIQKFVFLNCIQSCRCSIKKAPRS